MTTIEDKRAAKRQWYADHREHCREYKRAYNAARREKRNSRALEYRNADLAIFRDRERVQAWKRCGIRNPDGSQFILSDYTALFTKQAGKCAICLRHQSEFRYRLAADHSHTTGTVRGLLCPKCNTSLATLENKSFVSHAERYLGKDA